MSFAAVALGVGAVGTLGGAYLASQGARSQANATRDAADQNLAFTNDRYDESMARALFSVLGPQQGEAYLRAALPADRFDQLFGRAAGPAGGPSADQQRRLDAIDRQLAATPGGALRDRQPGGAAARNALIAERNAIMASTGGSPAIAGRMSLDALRAMGPGVTDQMRTLGASYDAATAGLMDQARSIEQQAQGYGQQERDRINRDSADALTSANRQAQSTLIGRGLGASTVLTGVMGQNARNIGAQREDALGSLGDRQINLLTGIRGNTLNMLAGRSAGSTELAQAPIQTRLSLMTGGIMNPWQNRDTTQFFPGVSSSGAAASTWGNALGAMGGQVGNLGLLGVLAQDQNFANLFGRR